MESTKQNYNFTKFSLKIRKLIYSYMRPESLYSLAGTNNLLRIETEQFVRENLITKYRLTYFKSSGELWDAFIRSYSKLSKTFFPLIFLSIGIFWGY